MISRRFRRSDRVRWAKTTSSTIWLMQLWRRNWTWKSQSTWRVIMILIWIGLCIRSFGPIYQSSRQSRRRSQLVANPKVYQDREGLSLQSRKIQSRIWLKFNDAKVWTKEEWHQRQKGTAVSCCPSSEMPERPARTSPNSRTSSNRAQ